MPSWWSALGEVWSALKSLGRLRAVGKRHRIDVVKRKIRRHVEHGQRQTAGRALVNYNTLVDIVEADECEYLQESLDELVADGILECVVGRFYALRGSDGRMHA